MKNKKSYKYYITQDDQKKLLSKAKDSGFVGRGAISLFLTKIATEPIVFLDANAKVILSVLQPQSP